jgi:hypothetical protein
MAPPFPATERRSTMGTILWKNLSTIPAEQREALCGDYDMLGHLIAGHEPTNVIYVYLRRGGVVEVRPATGVRLTGDTITVLNGNETVARYPRERVVQATRQPIEPTPLD